MHFLGPEFMSVPTSEARRPDYGSLARLGIILPSGNTATEPQFEFYRPDGVSFHFTRLALVRSSEEQLLAMPTLAEAAAALLKDAGVSTIAFHCTAVSTWDTALEAQILHRISTSTGLRTIATSQAIIAALRAVGARRISMLSPYPEAIAKREQRFMEFHGFEVVWNEFLGIETGDEMLAVPEAQWIDMVRRSPLGDTDACLISCTATRAIDIVTSAEIMFKKPIITSNSALLWYACRILQVERGHPGIGMLGKLHLERDWNARPG